MSRKPARRCLQSLPEGAVCKIPCNAQAGAIHGLVVVLKDPEASPRALAHASFVLKRLTATKHMSRASFMMSEGPAALLTILNRRRQCTE